MEAQTKDIVPDFLYKYFGESDWLFPEPTLRYSPAGILNDPYEVLPVVDARITAQEIKNLGKQHGIRLSHKKRKKLSREVNIDLRKNAPTEFAELCKKFDLGILSLTGNPTSAVMWGLYSSCQKGIVFKLDMTHDIFRPRDGFSPFRHVDYSPNRPVAKGTLGGRHDVRDWIYTKSKEWEFEDEWRSFSYRTSALNASPGVPGTFSIPPEAIKAVYFGLRTNGAFATAAEKFCHTHSIPCGRVQHHETEARLVLPAI